MAVSSPLVRAPRAISLVVVALIGTAVLAGCGPSPEPGSSSSATPKPTKTSTPTPTSTPEQTNGAVTSEPIDLSCDQLVTADDMYNFNPNFSLIDDGKPAADSKAGQIAGMGGLTCQWVNNSSGETIDIAVAKLTDDQLTALKNIAVTESNQVPTYGAPPVEGYFTVIGSQGEAQVFSDSYWITLRSTAFFEPGDAQPLSDAVIANLP